MKATKETEAKLAQLEGEASNVLMEAAAKRREVAKALRNLADVVDARAVFAEERAAGPRPWSEGTSADKITLLHKIELRAQMLVDDRTSEANSLLDDFDDLAIRCMGLSGEVEKEIGDLGVAVGALVLTDDGSDEP